jgi:heterodisulfide reductase subunit B
MRAVSAMKKEANTYSLFTGCLIPSKFPFIELASRKVLERLGLKLENIEEASCCPNQMAIQSSDKYLWYVLAARNLCLAEKKKHDILTLCNGCYDTLKSVNTKLKKDDKFRDEVNLRLEEFGLKFNGEIEVKHLVQVLHDDVGLNAIEKKVVIPLDGIKFAAFEGCHVKRPMDHMGFDSPYEPSYLSDLIKVLGGEPVSYSEHYSCCGGGLSVGRKDDVVPAARKVLRSALEADARALVVNCPFCFAQFFRGEKEIADIYSEQLKLPVLYITQLLGLTFGFTPEELGLPLHFKNSWGCEDELVTEILTGGIDKEIFNDEVTKSQLRLCEKCYACTDDCPTAMTTSEYRPEEILKLILSGKIEEAVSREDIWFCMNCHECTQLCPQDFGFVKLLVRLKNLAAAKGIYPETIGHRMSELHETGYSFPPNTEIRDDMELCKIKFPDMTELHRLMEKTKKEEPKKEGGEDEN